MNYRILLAATGVLGLAFAAGPQFSAQGQVTAKEKKGTCEFGANEQKLTGAERKKFLTRCMAKDDSEPKPKKKPKKKTEAKKEG